MEGNASGIRAYGTRRDFRRRTIRSPWGEDPEWIIRLAEEIRKHWDAERSYHENCEEERRKQQRKEKENKEQLKGKDQITRAEEQNRQFREKCSESGKEAVLVSSASDHHD